MFGQDFWDYIMQNGQLPEQLEPLAPMQAPPGTAYMPPNLPRPRFPLQENTPGARPDELGTRPPEGVSPHLNYGRPMQGASMGGGGLLDSLAMKVGGGSQLPTQGLLGGALGMSPGTSSKYGPMLMALGGGIAGGANQGWGAGIGRGLEAATLARMRSDENSQEQDYRQQLLKAKLAEINAPRSTDDMREFEFAKQQGFTGTFMDYMTSKQGTNVPSGFERSDGGLRPIKGGPADPDYLRSKPDRQNVPAGYEWDNEKQELRPIKGGPAGKLPQSAAGAVAMMDTAEKEMKKSNAEEVLLNMGHLEGDFKGGFGYGEIGRAQRSIRMAIEASLRLMTGAAAPKSEVDQYVEMFTPQGLESRATREQKLRALNEFMDSARANLLQGREPTEQREDPLGIR